MALILADTWGQNAGEAVSPRGTPLPRHAIPSDLPSYYATVNPGETSCGAIILPVTHWDGKNHNGGPTNEHYTQYAQVVVSEQSLKTLAAAGITPVGDVVYRNFHDCTEAARALNRAEHESYLAKYSNGQLSHVREWEQSAGDAQRVKDLCDHTPFCAESAAPKI